MNDLIFSNYPKLSDAAISEAQTALTTSSGYRRNQYKKLAEDEICSTLNRKHCILLSHCTNSLLVALLAAGVKKGDYVGVPSLTWVACVSSIIHVGAIPIFLDVDKDTFCLSDGSVEKAIKLELNYVLVVNLLGNLPRRLVYSKLNEAGITIIEDSAESLGASYDDGCKSGSLGHVSCLSFHATKLVNAGQGGALVTDNTALYERALELSHHGINTAKSGKYYWSESLGFNFAITDHQSALIYHQVKRLEDLVAHSRDIFDAYRDQLPFRENSRISISLMPRLTSQTQVFWLPIASILSTHISLSRIAEIRERLVAKGDQNGVQIRPLFYPLHVMPPFKKYFELNPTNLDTTTHLSATSFSLPTGAGFESRRVIDVKARINIMIDSLESEII